MSQQYCTFVVDDLYCGVPVEQVQEVLRAQALTEVPRARSVVAGLINLRGEIVTAIDLRRRLRLPDRPEGTHAMNVVVRTGDEPVSLLVDRIGDVVAVDDATYEPPPPTLTGTARELITGTYKLADQLLLVLDTHHATTTEA